MLLLLTRYWSQIAAATVALLAGLWLASLWYAPKVDRAVAEAATLRATVAIQSEAVASLHAQAEAARKRTQEALAAHKKKADEQARAVDRLRRELRDRTHKDEPCEFAAEAARQQWLSR